MSAVMQQTDPTRGMSLVSNVNPDREKTRYLFFAGQILDPDRVQQMEHIREAGGGEEVQANTLRRTVGGFVPRARLTPMEKWLVSMPIELIGEGAEASTVRIQGPMTAEGLGMKRPGQLIGKPLSSVQFYPGDEINSVLRANGDKGMVEVATLKGVSWYEDEAETRPGVPQVLNRDFFPTLPPPTLRELREAIEKASVRSELHAAVAREMRAGCDRFERWANATLAVEHNLLRQRVSHQFTYTYSPVGRELLRQLEMKAQDTIMDGQYDELIKTIAAQRGGGLSPQDIGAIVREVISAMSAKPASDTATSGTTSEQGEPKAETKPETPKPEGQPAPRRRQNSEG